VGWRESGGGVKRKEREEVGQKEKRERRWGKREREKGGGAKGKERKEVGQKGKRERK